MHAAAALVLAASVRIGFDMPFDGKATLALDGPDGRRVRNLVNGIAFAKGRHEVEWDGRSEDGTGAPPGRYTVRVVAHPGIGYDFRGAFAAGGERMFSGFGPNHLPCTMLAAAGETMVAASLFTEGGNSTLVLSHDGKLLNGYGDGWNLGNKACFYLSATNDWIYSVRERDGNELEFHCYGLLRNARRSAEVSGAPKTSLKGAARIGDKVYLSNALTKTVDAYRLEDGGDRARLVFTGEREAHPFVGPLCADGETLVHALSGRQKSIAVKGGELFALEEGDSVVHVYDRASGRETRTFGERGNGYAGPWRRNRLVNPAALAFDAAGSLWIAESRYNPKRISRWNAESGICEYEKVGSEKYGSPGVGMDEEDATRWIAHDTEWRYDPARGVDEPVAELFDETIPQGDAWDVPPRSSRTYRFARRGGKTYVIGNDGVTMFWEYLDAERRLRPLAMVGSSGFYSHMIGRQHSSAPIGEAYAKAFPGKGGDKFKHDESTLMVWHDLDGDERFDADEFEFGPYDAGAPCGWGLFASGLDFTLPISIDGEMWFLDFSFPEWSLAKALASKRKMKGTLPSGASVPLRTENYCARDGRFIFPTQSPYMTAYLPDGTLEWYMKNPHSNVHGSHNAPMPRPGELQGALFPLGSVPGGANGEYEVFALKNNHGRVFFITTDGIYLDEIFSDCRVAAANDETYIGGESFGGSFQWDAKGRRAVLTSGGGGYRWYEITNLSKIAEKRYGREFSAKELVAAQEANPVVGKGAAARASLAVPDAKSPAQVASWQVGAWHVRVHACRDGGRLKLRYSVSEPSPWVNNGTDPYLMFKTGDAVDFQYLDEGGKPCRLMVFPPDRAVLYRHEAKGASRDFSSPWRTHTVGDVSFPTNLSVSVRKGGGDYTVSFDAPGDYSSASELRCDFGVIFGDRDGTVNLSRSYWSNKDTGLVNDVPGEIIPEPRKWGTVRFGSASASAADAPRAPQAAKLRRLGEAVNPFALPKAPDGRGYHGEAYAAGPVYDWKRGLLYASAGRGRVVSMTLEGRPVSSHVLPGARAFDRFDSMAIDDRTGEVYVLAGGLAAQNPRRGERAAGRLYRIRPGVAEADLVAEGICAISQKAREGRLVVMTPESTLDWLSCADGSRSPLYRTPMRNGAAYPCMIDYAPDGRVLAFVEHRTCHMIDADGKDEVVRPFGSREICMTRGAVIGDEFWALNGETVKRYDARTMKPDPGVVYGGASGYVIAHVVTDSGFHAVGMCEVPGGLYAVLSSVDSAVYLVRYDASAWTLVPVKRLGGVHDVPNFALDDDGFLAANSLVWGWDAKSDAPTSSTLRRMPVRATVVLPDGRTLHVTETHGRRVEFRHGRLSDVELKIDHSRDARDYPEPGDGHGQKWDAYHPVADFALPREGGRATAFAMRADGVVKTYAVDREGHPEGEGASWCGESRLPRPDGAEGDFTAFAPLPDGRFAAQVGGRAFAYSKSGGNAPEWKCEGALPELDGDGLDTDGATVAVVKSAAGELALFAYEGGKVRRLDSCGGLVTPSRVRVRRGRVAVWEKSVGRILRFEF